MSVDLVAALLFAARWIHFIFLVVSFGVALFPLYAWGGETALRDAIGRPFERWRRIGAIGVFVSGLLWFFLAVASMAGDPAAALDADSVSSVALDMDFGRIWLARMALAAVFIVATLRPRKQAGETPLLEVLLAGALLASVAFTGHGPSGPGVFGAAHAGLDAAHLLAAGAWLGALTPLVLLSGAGPQPGSAEAFARLLRRFSTVGVGAVTVLILTGVCNASVMLGTLPALFTTGYGRVLLAKLALVIVMLVIAVLNRLRSTPALASADDPAPALRALTRRLYGEQAAGLLVLGAVALLGMMAPPGAA